MYSLLVTHTYLVVFRNSASSAAVHGLATDPFFILLGARRSTKVASQTSCLPSSQGAMVIPSGPFPSDTVRTLGSKTEGTLMELRACFTRTLRLWCLENLPALLLQEILWCLFPSTSFQQRQVCFRKLLDRGEATMRSTVADQLTSDQDFCLVQHSAKLNRRGLGTH